MLSDQMKSLDLRKVPGVKGLVVKGYDGDPAERVLGASLALGQAIRDGTVSALEDVTEPSSDEMEASYEPVQKYVAATKTTLGGKSDVETKGPPPPPPLPSAWPMSSTGGEKGVGMSASSSDRPPLPVPATPSGDRGEQFSSRFRRTASYLWSSCYHAKNQELDVPEFLQWNSALGVPPFIEATMRPTYLAAVAAGDPGKLCQEGYFLFTDIHLAEKSRQTSMASIWSKPPKVDVTHLPKASY